MKTIPLLMILIILTASASKKMANEMIYETLPSHLILMTKKEIEKKLTELAPNAEHYILYFNPQSTKLTKDSENILPNIIKNTHHKIPSMINIISSHDQNGSFDLSIERLEKVERLLSKKGFKYQTLTAQLDRNEMFVFLVSTCCPKQQSSISLLNNKKAHNSILVQNKQGALLLDKPLATVEMTSSEKLPTEVRMMSQTEFDLRFGTLNKMIPKAPKEFRLFFQAQNMSLTDESRAEIPNIISEIYQNMPCVVDVIGHTDTMGSKRYNFKLGLGRAKMVAKLLETQGVDRKNLNLKSYGEESLFVQTPDNVPEAQNRHVEILIK